MSNISVIESLIIRDKMLGQLNIADKGDKISFSLRSDAGEPQSEIEIKKEGIGILLKWLARHIKTGEIRG